MAEKQLTVGDLIDRLSTLPRDAPVFAESYDQFCKPVTDAKSCAVRGGDSVIVVRTSDDADGDLYT